VVLVPVGSAPATGGGIPENAETIWKYLIAQGFSSNAAAGILGNIEQESGGSITAGNWPGNYGLIQWTPANDYFSSPPNLGQQLAGIVTYINKNGSVQAINQAATSPSAAALYFSNEYERPNPADANNAYREASAQAVYQAAQTGNWPTSSGSTSTQPTTATTASYSQLGVSGILGDVNGLTRDVATVLDYMFGMFGQGQGWRLAFTALTILTAIGAYKVMATATAA
jgi:Phage tail lysozyme